MPPRHRERHRTERTGWLRAAVLGANDGIVSTASLIMGVAAAGASRAAILTAGAASLVAGAMSMAAGEYVSVSSQADTENADLERERRELATDVEGERKELASIYAKRGVEAGLARQVAEQLMAFDALGAHARDELGISEILRAQPLQAAVSSAAAFASGAALPLVTALLSPQRNVSIIVAITALFFLATLGALAAQTGGSPPARAVTRVTFWGALAMALTSAVGSLFGTALG